MDVGPADYVLFIDATTRLKWQNNREPLISWAAQTYDNQAAALDQPRRTQRDWMQVHLSRYGIRRPLGPARTFSTVLKAPGWSISWIAVTHLSDRLLWVKSLGYL